MSSHRLCQSQLWVISLWVCLLSSTVASIYDSAADVVTSLPDLVGPPIPPDSMFAGYLNVSGRHYYYVFVRAETNPDTAPFLFWTNGGPGCSSVGEGLWMEHGPYKVTQEHGGVEPNPFSWNKLANVLYLEHPVGVGFSFSENASDYTELTDFREADDLYAALNAFIEKYPRFAPNKEHGMYLTGESYGGEYVPHLAHRIAFGESELLKSALKGIAVANPELNCAADRSGYSASLQYQLLFHHGLMSFQQFRKWADLGCDGKSRGLDEDCQKLLQDAMSAVGTINQQLLKRRRRQSKMLSGRKLAESKDDKIEANFDPDHKYQSFCLANSTLSFVVQNNADTQSCHPLGDPGRMVDYLNRVDVQKALHVRPEKIPAPNGRWTACAGDWINYNASSVNVLTSYIEPIFAVKSPSEFRMLVFSGDEDIATCPAPITMACLSDLDGKVQKTRDWGPWTYNGITAGYYEEFDRYTYATVKGAGHTVPQYQPLTTFQLLSRWLRNASLEAEPVKQLRRVEFV